MDVRTEKLKGENADLETPEDMTLPEELVRMIGGTPVYTFLRHS